MPKSINKGSCLLNDVTQKIVKYALCVIIEVHTRLNDRCEIISFNVR